MLHLSHRARIRLISIAIPLSLTGSFYASTGPEIHELAYEDGVVLIKCSGAKMITVNTDCRFAAFKRAEEGELVTEAALQLNPAVKFFRISVTDGEGRHAETNAYYVEDLADQTADNIF